MLFGVHPWEMMFLDDTKRTWYEMAAYRHRIRERDIRVDFLNAIGRMFSSDDSSSVAE